MKAMRFRHGVAMMSGILKVSKSGYYKWLNRKPSKRAQEEGGLEVEIRAAHKRTHERYGPERLQHELKEQGIKVGICRIRRIRKKLGIRCKQKRKFKAATDSTHALPVAENLNSLRRRGRMKYGSVTLPIFPQKKAGSIWLVIRIFLQEKSLDMPWGVGLPRTL